MVTRSDDCVKRDQCVRNGNGLVHFKDIANQDELYGHARLFSHLIIEPGRSIGEHTHEHETEFFYILKGEGQRERDYRPSGRRMRHRIRRGAQSGKQIRRAAGTDRPDYAGIIAGNFINKNFIN